MGQAKRRGNQEQRIAEAQIRERAKFPDTITCNHCQAQLTEIKPIDVRNVPDVWLTGYSICPACKSTTWALDGTQEGITMLSSVLFENSEDVAVGMVDRQK